MTPTDLKTQRKGAMTMVAYKIFIDGYSFTARENTIDVVEAALKEFGFTYNKQTEGWESNAYTDAKLKSIHDAA